MTANPHGSHCLANVEYVNQCDGCRCGWPTINGVHWDPDKPRTLAANPIGCTAHLYGPAIPTTPSTQEGE